MNSSPIFYRSADRPQIAGSEAVLPAYLIGMALVPLFIKDHELRDGPGWCR